MAKRAGVYGAKGVSAAFRELRRNITRPVDAAARKALRPILNAAKANTEHASVKKALVMKKDRKAPKSKPTHLVGGDPKNPDYRLLHLLEFGVEPHKIGDIQHPGHAAQPFATPAYEAHGAEAIKIFGRELGPAVEKDAARMAKKYAGKK